MTWEQAGAGMAILSVVLQFVNLYITANIKLWVTEKFVSKDDLRNTLYWRDAARKEEAVNVGHA